MINVFLTTDGRNTKTTNRRKVVSIIQGTIFPNIEQSDHRMVLKGLRTVLQQVAQKHLICTLRKGSLIKFNDIIYKIFFFFFVLILLV